MSGHAEGSRLSGRYLILGKLGEGGMGVVLHAKDERLGRSVAVKVLAASVVGDAGARRRLVLEARAAAALEHPAIVSVYDVGETDEGTTYLVMELVRGRSLRALLEPGALPMPGRLRAIVDVARALGFAHRAHVLHRDIKPDNVMIRDDGRTVLMDFGIAKTVSTTLETDTAPALTGPGAFIGTIAYLAPETARGLLVDGRADQFALALTAYEAITGRLPWTGTSAVEILSAIVRDEPVPLDSELLAVLGDTSAMVEAVLRRALSKAPGDRYPTMDAFADALEACAALPVDARAASPSPALDPTEQAPIVVTPGKPPVSTAAVTEPELGGARPRTSAAPVPRRRAAAVLGLIGVALVVIGSIGGARWSGTFRSSAAVDAGSPAADPFAAQSPVVACPQLRVTGVEEPAGWLGAAIATIACGRAQILLGGGSARTQLPAELLDLPRTPVDDFPLDPYGPAEARGRAVAAAKTRASAWFDGEVTRRPDGLSVTLVLRSADDRELARGTGAGRHPLHATRAAMEALRGATPLPAAGAPSSWLSKWMRVRTTTAALLLNDQALVVATEDRDAIRVECARADASHDMEDEARYSAASVCAYLLYTAPPAAPAHVDMSLPGAARYMLSVDQAPPPDEAKATARRLHELFEKETDPQARSLLLGTEALNLMFAGDPREAAQLARRSLAIDTKVAEPWTSNWRIFAFATGDKARSASSAGWIPWDPYSVINVGELDTAPDAKLRYARRAAILAPGGAPPHMLVDLLLKARRIEEARGVAAVIENPMVDVQVRAAEGHFGAALARAEKAMVEAPTTAEGAITVFSVARVTADVALILERPLEYADPLVKRFVEPDPPVLPRSYGSYLGLIATCTYAPASVAKRCIPRLRALHARGVGFPGLIVEQLLAGAERYVNGDHAGAAKAWRSLLKETGRGTEALRHAMALTFDRQSLSELAAKVDATSFDGRYNGADLANVREARRALRAGDREAARKHASLTIEAWSVADDTVPAVAEMRKVLAAAAP